LIPNPIHKVLSTLSCHGVKHLLMGGQACVFYGAAEFSRDCDIVIVSDADNLKKLESALEELEAECIAVPPMDWKHLERGHAIHFRCKHPEAGGIRLDVMTKLRGCGDFALLWEQRATIQDGAGFSYELLGIEDLVRAKKTQREKDWPMIRRLVDAHYDEFRDDPTGERVRFWLRESRTPEVLIAVGAKHPHILKECIGIRPFLAGAMSANRSAILMELEKERIVEMETDARYWQPLKKELESLRMNRRR